MSSAEETDDKTPGIAEVAAALRANPAVGRRLQPAVLLAGWVGSGRKVTSTGVPKPADAAGAARACGLGVPPGKITRAARIPGLVEAWDLALATGLVELAADQALPGPNRGAWPDGPDEQVVEVWLAAFARAIGLEVGEEAELIAGDGGLLTLSVLELLGAGPRSLTDLRAELDDALRGDLGPTIALIRMSVQGDPERVAVGHLVDWGLAECEGGLASLSAPGVFARRELGLEPVRQLDPALDAAGLLAALAAESELGPEAAESWLAARPARAAAEQLLAAAAGTDPLSRVMAIGLAQSLGPEAAPAWKRAARLPGVGPHARMYLYQVDSGAQPSPGDSGWIAADLGAAVATLADRGIPREQFDALIDDVFADLGGQERADLASAIRASGHPGAATALGLLAAEGDPAGAPAKPGYQLKVTLLGLRPPVWRRITVPADTSLAALHHVIQAAMGWEDYHMHVFNAGRASYGLPDRELGHRDAKKVPLSRVLGGVGDRIGYTYDLGDCWEHEILLEKTVATVGRPACVDGRRHCPPEDCGGVWAYQDLVQALTDKDDERHEELTEWMEEAHGLTDFDPEFFDPAEADARLARLRL
ncbi:plasmid pRiA4b ORF-3 family protein [Actinocrinis puniceicyclus]|uniref:Plasmid pRiA4b ORF-3 family protein n=1 Tax=Actinocrinis puniceicyclus TaxID=977794 RepID=A0A8J8BAZ5_9ACTN|nr:plasmid pRiA4b ORF-3 family protein [Actinocrinis puniceicyclus]MBS2961900.1 plasmid pRiA4b ORF-3 family protein [Actinocrinis puniceicyclus]